MVECSVISTVIEELDRLIKEKIKIKCVGVSQL